VRAVRPQASRDQAGLTMMLRPGNAGSNTAIDHIAVIKGAQAQLPGHRPGTRAARNVLICTDGAGSTHAVLNWLTAERLPEVRGPAAQEQVDVHHDHFDR